MKRFFAIICLMTLFMTMFSIPDAAMAASSSRIGFTSHLDGASISADTKQTFKWNSISGAKSYAYSIRDLTTDRKLIENTYTTSCSFSLNSSKLVQGHSIRVWVAAYTGKNGAGSIISQTTITLKIKAAAAQTVQTASIRFTSHNDGASINATANQTIKWNSISNAKSYAYSVRDLTSNKKLIKNTYTMGCSFTLNSSKLVQGHKIRVWVAAYTGRNGTGSIISQTNITLNIPVLAAKLDLQSKSGTEIAQNTNLTLTWSYVSGTKNYQVYVKDTTISKVLINNKKTTSTTYTVDKSLIGASRRLSITVTALDRNGNKLATDSLTVTTKASTATCSTGNASIKSSSSASTTVTFTFDVLLNGGANVTDCGIEYGTSKTNLNKKVSKGSVFAKKGTFSVKATLKAGKYYFRAYAKNKLGTTYGSIKEVTVYTCPFCKKYTGTYANVYAHCISSGDFKKDPVLKLEWELGKRLITAGLKNLISSAILSNLP